MKKKTTTTKRKKRVTLGQDTVLVDPPSPYFERTEDAKDIAAMAKVQNYMLREKSRFGVIPTLTPKANLLTLQKYRDETQRQLDILDKAIGRVSKRVKTQEKSNA